MSALMHVKRAAGQFTNMAATRIFRWVSAAQHLPPSVSASFLTHKATKPVYISSIPSIRCIQTYLLVQMSGDKITPVPVLAASLCRWTVSVGRKEGHSTLEAPAFDVIIQSRAGRALSSESWRGDFNPAASLFFFFTSRRFLTRFYVLRFM